MRVLSKSRLREFWEASPRHTKSERALRQWYDMVDAANWKSPADVKAVFGKNVDFVQVKSGNTLGVFNICGNDFRLIAAIHYNYPRVFVLRIMTHREYDQNKWKDEL